MQPPLPLANHPDADGIAAAMVASVPPRLSFAIGASGDNLARYGSIRPPVSVIQDEFLEIYRLWREHAEPLDGIDGLLPPAGGGAGVWQGHMARIQKLHTRYHRSFATKSNRDRDHEDWGRSADLLLKELRAEKKCSDEENVAVSDQDEESVGCEIAKRDSSGDDERKKLEGIASLIFYQGARLTGSIEIQHEKCRSNYELVVMEGNMRDELGRPKGVLARHKVAGDQQCVFVKISIVPIERSNQVDDEKNSDQAEDKSHEEDPTVEVEGADGEHKSTVPSKEKLTIRIEYFDGDNLTVGLWNHDTLCFNGLVKKQTEGQGDHQQMGGTIINRILSDNRSANDESSRSIEGNNPRIPSVATVKFTLSPCTHLHPRGIFPAPSRQILSEALSCMVLISQAEINLAQDFSSTHPIERKDEAFKSERHRAFLEELASIDNYKLILHRSRTDTLRLETLKKLVELGSLIDFAELAKKRNVAKRREKWRRRMRKYTPKMPRRLLRRGRMSKMTSEEDYPLAKDDLQKKKVHFHDLLATISWGDLLVEASIQSEKTCANFRRQRVLLDNLTFESDEYKAQIMADLRAYGMTLAGSHFEWDKCIQMARAVALGWSWFEKGSWSCFDQSAIVGKRCVYLLFMMHSRLEINHKHLENAFRGADSRLTGMELRRIREISCAALALKANDCEGAGLCGVCQCDMDEDFGNSDDANTLVCLPCSHSYHWDCVKQWLHDHSSCPSCRFDLTANGTQNDQQKEF
ncbi:hypothetical protein ACHAXA_002566 [Cyclostephanos tholiformis]|uniref:RING-type domain-containing protein n=1 Tax=Cyclostephanos tholiformis TaxID=382380 RepID=A0ABD3RIH4_9STRA